MATSSLRDKLSKLTATLTMLAGAWYSFPKPWAAANSNALETDSTGRPFLLRLPAREAAGLRGTHGIPRRLHRPHESVKSASQETLAAWQLLQARLRGCPWSEEQSSPSRWQRLQGRLSVQAVLDARQ